MPLMKGRSASSFGRRSNHFMISAWTRRPDFRTDTRLVGLEVVPEQAGESLGRRVRGRSVAPGVTWQEDFPGRAGTLGYHVKPEHGVSLRLRLRQRSAVDAFDDGPGALEADALAHTVRTASPAGVHQPDARLVLLHLGGEKLGVLVGMPHEEWTTKARREGCLRLGHTDFRAGDLCRVTADEMIHGMRWRQ